MPPDHAGEATVSPPHAAEIDALRGVVILLVLVSSYVTLYQTLLGHGPGLAVIPPVGFLALQLFLALASYRLLHDLQYVGLIRDYVTARVLRYLPALWPALAIAAACSWAGGVAALQAPLAALPANLIMAADVLGAPTIEPACWRLKIELMLSVVLGAAWFGCGRRMPPSILLAALALALTQATGAEPVHLHTLSLSGLLTLDGYLAPCAFGIALYHLVASPRSPAWLVVAAVCVAMVPMMNAPLHAAWVLLAFFAAALAASGCLPGLARCHALIVLGELSFPIFVLHQIPGFLLIRSLESAGLHPAAAAMAAGAAAIGAGWLLHHWLEVPIRDRATSLLNGFVLKRSGEKNEAKVFATLADA